MKNKLQITLVIITLLFASPLFAQFTRQQAIPFQSKDIN